MKSVSNRIIILMLVCLSGCAANPAERNNTGSALYNQGDYPNALNAYQAAQVLSPDSPEPYFNAASALAQQSRVEEAVAALEQALKTSDEVLTEQAYYNLGNIYFEMASYEEAIRAYQQALLLKPSDEDARYNLELALSRIIPPSPTPLGDNNADATPTPTLDNQNAEGATPTSDFLTPTPQESPNQTGGETPPPAESTMLVEQSEQLLDSIQQYQGKLPNMQATDQPPGNSQPQKDW